MPAGFFKYNTDRDCPGTWLPGIVSAETGPPVEIIKNLATACALADGGHRNKTGQVLGGIARP